MVAPLSTARPGEPLPGVPFSREAVANAFVMLGLLPEARAEEILAGYRPELEAKGFRFGVLTGELSVRPGAHGYQDALAASRDDLTGIPLAVAVGPVPIAFGETDLVLTGATLTPGGVKLRLRAVIPDPSEPHRRSIRGRPGLELAEEIGFGLPGQRSPTRSGPGFRWPTTCAGRTGCGRKTGAARPGDQDSGGGTARCWRNRKQRAPSQGKVSAGWSSLRRRPGRSGRHASSRTGRYGPGGAAVADAGRGLPGGTGVGHVDVDGHRRGHGGTRHSEDRRRGGRRAALGRGAAADSAVLAERPASFGWQEALAELWGGQAYQRARNGKPERGGPGCRPAVAAGHGGDRGHRSARRPRVHRAVQASVGDRRVLADDHAEFPGAGDR